MKLNNKGFAITGILYTLFILFIMILLSILSGLNTRKNIMEKSVETLANDYKWGGQTLETSSSSAPKTGKYKYIATDGTEKECYTYLKSGASLDTSNIIFTTKECNDAKTSGTPFTLTNIYWTN